MANRQSLKDLQERLAQRLSAAKTEAAVASWLAVEASGQRFLLPLVQSGEIFPWAAVQAVPYTKPWYLGVSSRRGGLHGVVDLARLVGGVAGASPHTERITSESRLVSFHHALGINAVLLIDRLLGLRNPANFSTLAQVPEGAPAYFSRCLIDMQGQTWQEVDLQGLATEPEFLAIAA
jgi:twitching motility protein PilI